MSIGLRIGAILALVIAAVVILTTFQRPTTASVQHGFRGTGMDLIYHKAELAAATSGNVLPDAIDPVDKAGILSKTIYKNVKVLGDVDVAEFQRLMASITAWVAPTQGCNYCHSADGNFASDDLYTKRVARRMLQMTRHINADWKSHVAQIGVTCYTCHRGNPVPSYIWFDNPGPPAGMAVPAPQAGDASLPNDPFTPFLQNASEIRVNSATALPTGDRQSIKQTEYTYALMMHMSNALGVNCTYCHNTRAFSNWSQSTPQRVNAWYGIRMVRDIDEHFMASLQSTFPAARLGPHGDVAKVNCTTCHQGAYKPLLGASMVKTYPELLETADVASVEAPAAPPAAVPASQSPAAPTPPAAAPAAPPAPLPPTAAAPGGGSDAGPAPYSAPTPADGSQK